jgi:hypothetical protein
MKIIDCEQGTEEWFQHKCGIPSTSSFGKFITPARGDYSKQATGYIADLIVESVEGPGENISSYWMERGTELEPEARRCFEFDHGVEVREVGVIINHGFGYSPDGLFDKLTPDLDLYMEGLEIKCPKPSTHVKWLLDGELPVEHKPQVHGAMVVGELDRMWFMSYCPRYKPLIVEVLPDGYTKKIEVNMATFLKDLAVCKAVVLA